MKKLLVIAEKDFPEQRLLRPLEKYFEISVEMNPAGPVDPDAVLLWEHNESVVKKLLEQRGKLHWIHTRWAGVEKFISPEIQASDVIVTNAKGVYAESLAEFALTGMLFFAKDLRRMMSSQKVGKWDQFELRYLSGKRLGVIGLGGIGQAIAKKAAALSMKVTAFQNRSRVELESRNIELKPLSDLEALLPSFDYVTSSLPLTGETHHFFNAERFAKMNSGSVFINVGRGPTMDESALVALLQQGKIRGAALDVYEQEPLPPESPLWKLENVLLSAHTADRTETWLDETMELFVENATLFAEGKKLKNIVDKSRGY